MQALGKPLIFLGIAMVIIGTLLTFSDKLPNLGLGKLPGDIHIKGKNGSFYFPITTCILISALLSLIGWIIRYFSK